MKPNEYMAKSQAIKNQTKSQTGKSQTGKSQSVNGQTIKTRTLSEPVRVKNYRDVKELRFRRAAVVASRAKTVTMKAKYRADSTMKTDEYRSESQYATDNVLDMGRGALREGKNEAIWGVKGKDRAEKSAKAKMAERASGEPSIWP